MISNREVKQLLKKYWFWDIPQETIDNVREYFECKLKELAESIVKCHGEYNHNRERYGLKPKRRLDFNENDLCEYLKSSGDYINHFGDVRAGTSGQHNRETVVSRASMEVA